MAKTNSSGTEIVSSNAATFFKCIKLQTYDSAMASSSGKTISTGLFGVRGCWPSRKWGPNSVLKTGDAAERMLEANAAAYPANGSPRDAAVTICKRKSQRTESSRIHFGKLPCFTSIQSRLKWPPETARDQLLFFTRSPTLLMCQPSSCGLNWLTYKSPHGDARTR